MNPTDSTVFVPGATSGIGLALARRLQQRSSTVVIGGRRTERLEQLAARHGFGTALIDTADPASITAATTDVLARYPELDVLVALAG